MWQRWQLAATMMLAIPLRLVGLYLSGCTSEVGGVIPIRLVWLILLKG